MKKIYTLISIAVVACSLVSCNSIESKMEKYVSLSAEQANVALERVDILEGATKTMVGLKDATAIKNAQEDLVDTYKDVKEDKEDEIEKLDKEISRPDGFDLCRRGGSFAVFDEFIAAAIAETPLGVQIIGLPVGHEAVGGVLFGNQFFEHTVIDRFSVIRASGVDFNGADVFGKVLAVDHLELGVIGFGIGTDLEAVGKHGALKETVEACLFHLLRNGAFGTENGVEAAGLVEVDDLFHTAFFKVPLVVEHGRTFEKLRLFSLDGGDHLEVDGGSFSLPAAVFEPVSALVKFFRGGQRAFHHDRNGVLGIP